METLAAGSEGTRLLLELADTHGARFLLASTSEVYGDPTVHPQVEGYRGNVDPVGPRSVYDEAKRFAEALTMASTAPGGSTWPSPGSSTPTVPAWRPGTGGWCRTSWSRRWPAAPLTVYGDGIPDPEPLLRGRRGRRDCWPCSTAAVAGPVNIGNPDERTVLDLATRSSRLTGSRSEIVHVPLPADDPTRRCPDITLARRVLGWEPTVALDEGSTRTIEYFSARHLDAGDRRRSGWRWRRGPGTAAAGDEWSAVVVDYDAGDVLAACVGSLLDEGVGRVVVVENGAGATEPAGSLATSGLERAARRDRAQPRLRRAAPTAGWRPAGPPTTCWSATRTSTSTPGAVAAAGGGAGRPTRPGRSSGRAS